MNNIYFHSDELMSEKKVKQIICEIKSSNETGEMLDYRVKAAPQCNFSYC